MLTEGGQADKNEKQGVARTDKRISRIWPIFKNKRRWHRIIPWVNATFFLVAAILAFSLIVFSSLAMGARNITQTFAVEPDSSLPDPTRVETGESAALADESSPAFVSE